MLWGDDRNDGWGEYADAGRRSRRSAIPAPSRTTSTAAAPASGGLRGSSTRPGAGHRLGRGRCARAEPRRSRTGCASAATTCSATAGAGSSRGGCSRDEEREHLQRAIETFERVARRAPARLELPLVAERVTRELLVEEGGFLYDSDGWADDVPVLRAVPGGPFLVVPYSKTYNDSRYLDEPGVREPARLPRHADDGARRAGPRGAADDDDRRRARALERPGGARGRHARVSRARLAKPGVRFMRRVDIARWWLATYPQ